MADYMFYTNTYLGDSIPEADFPRLAQRAGEQLGRYKRLYEVTAPETDSEDMACLLYTSRISQDARTRRIQRNRSASGAGAGFMIMN